MAVKLLIVESPTKVRTIKKFLGKQYQVIASNGHIKDMPKSQLGISPDNDFEPKYITIRGKGPVLAEIKKEVKKADHIYLATDPDREGEAIAWHLQQSLQSDNKTFQRITFQEITKKAVTAALQNPRNIDRNLVDAQQARRVLDRIVGYKISPLLWNKVKSGLSAGRVQSAALRLLQKKEEEIEAFIPEEYWTFEGVFCSGGEEISAHYLTASEQQNIVGSEEEAKKIKAKMEQQEYVISEISDGTRKKKAPLPFTTSTLQQEASNSLNFSTQKTMRIAQQLYEGIELGKNGLTGLITYLRTDSVRISQEAKEAAGIYIRENYGLEYCSTEERKHRGNKIQDAHEAIRPTDITITPETVKDDLSREQYKLYRLIWQRFTASCMKDSIYRTRSFRIQGGGYNFRTNYSNLEFDGFQKIYGAKNVKEKRFPENLREGDKVYMRSLEMEQHFTQAPVRYTEAALVKAMEENGIGRPSTYAPIINTLLKRRYAVKEDKKLYVTEIGSIVDSIMVRAFPEIVDIQFTASMELLLDFVAEGKTEWKTLIRNFYPDIENAVQKAEKDIPEFQIQDQTVEEKCPVCGKNLVIKYGRYGQFLACPGFPECRHTQPYFEKTGVKCPKCDGEIVVKHTKKGRRYYGCTNYPDCEFMSWQKPSDKKCPICGAYLIEKGNNLACSDPKCSYKEKQ